MGEPLIKEEMEHAVNINKNPEIAIIIMSGFWTFKDKLDIKC